LIDALAAPVVPVGLQAASRPEADAVAMADVDLRKLRRLIVVVMASRIG
jgi:hypothetical protein